LRVLITGKNSYIGNSVKSWLNKKEPTFLVDEVSLRNINLNAISFRDYDVVIHVAGIAHITSNKKLISQYFKINLDLTIKVAQKAKNEGVNQFIFTSSMAIYGRDRSINDLRPVNVEKPSPNDAYGQSKYEADIAVQKLQDDSFHIAILRVPMVYGKNAKGNFIKLVKLANKLMFFPLIQNIRSVIHIDSLSELIRLIILRQLKGVFYPQDSEYFSTTKFIRMIREKKGKKTIFVSIFNPFIKLLSHFIGTINKIYGNKYYEINHSMIKGVNYQVSSISDVIQELKDIY
jgi:nucleoside-diphosphate-sugar epimerase